MNKTYMTIISITFTIYTDESPKTLDILGDIEMIRNAALQAGNKYMDHIHVRPNITMINSSSSIHIVEEEDTGIIPLSDLPF